MVQEKEVQVRRFTFSRYEGCALVLILLAASIRIALLLTGWPLLDSDEGTMGLMAMHIAYRGEHPIFFYGQGYMGAFEAYAAAVVFHFFGVSTFGLRIGLVLMYCVFLLGMYLLTSMLYSKKLALFTLFLLALGSNPLLTRQLVAVGGDPETLMCGPLLLLIPVWLVFNSGDPEQMRRDRWRRLLAYALWGFVAGFGLWSHMLTAPFILAGGLLLLIFCWRELLGWATVLIVIGFIPCTYLQVLYNQSVPPNRSSLFYLLNVLKAGGTPVLPRHILLPLEIKGALLITLPTATGASPLCADSDVHAVQLGSLHGWHCTLIHTGWSAGVILLWLAASLLALFLLWRLCFGDRSRGATRRPWGPETRRAVILQCSRLAVLGACAIPVLLYTVSPNSAFYPVAASRYLIGVLVATPAILWPLWHGATLLKSLALRWRQDGTFIGRVERVSKLLSRVVLAGIAVVLFMGTFSTFTNIPAQPPLDPTQDVYFTQNSTQHLNVPLTQEFNQQEGLLITTLLHDHLTHIYSDYWSCDRLIFRSSERIYCSALQDDLSPGHNRWPYLLTVNPDPLSAYVFLANTVPDATLTKRIAAGDKKYQGYHRFVVGGYAVYQRSPSGK
jgi:hypothetical protein